MKAGGPDLHPDAPTGWRALLLRAGHGRAVAAITLVSVLVSVLLTWAVVVLRGREADLLPNLAVAVIVPLLVAPLVSHRAMGLLYELEEARRRLQEVAIRDGLTRAYNRRFFMARLDVEAVRARREGQALSVLMIDVDHFKRINDEHGHAAGDQALEAIADALVESMRPYDLVARYGGEEFVALMPGAALDQAMTAAERVRRAIEALRLPMPGGRALTLTASLGVSALGAGEDAVTELLARADRAMYEAKNAGRNRCVSG